MWCMTGHTMDNTIAAAGACSAMIKTGTLVKTRTRTQAERKYTDPKSSLGPAIVIETSHH